MSYHSPLSGYISLESSIRAGLLFLRRWYFACIFACAFPYKSIQCPKLSLMKTNIEYKLPRLDLAVTILCLPDTIIYCGPPQPRGPKRRSFTNYNLHTSANPTTSKSLERRSRLGQLNDKDPDSPYLQYWNPSSFAHANHLIRQDSFIHPEPLTSL